MLINRNDARLAHGCHTGTLANLADIPPADVLTAANKAGVERFRLPGELGAADWWTVQAWVKNALYHADVLDIEFDVNDSQAAALCETLNLRELP